jgi:HAE1 family hydrophobic/amphiphilic exporter-1
MGKLTSISIRSGSAVALAAVIALIAGLIAAANLKQELIPTLELPVAAVITSSPGSSVDAVEADITVPIERALQDVPDLEGITSMSHEGSSIVILQLEYGTDQTQLRAEVRDRLATVTLPDETGEPALREISLDDFPVLALSVGGEQSPEELYAQLQSSVLPPLQQVEGVSTVQLSGGGTREAVIEPDAERLTAAGTTPSALVAAVRASAVVEPIGTVVEDDAPIPVSISERNTDLKAIEQVALLPDSGARPGTTIADVAEIRTVEVPADTRLRVDGEPAIGLNITKLSDATTVQVVDDVRAELDERLATLPGNVKATTIFDQGEPITEAIAAIVREGLLGIVFAVIVIFAFLRSVRATLVAALSIPLSLAIALLVLWQQGFTLNVLTLGALTIAVGRVVDDSIVVIENIFRHLSDGDPPIEAAFTGTREVLPAITASTLTTIAVFGPIAFVGGIAEQLFAPFALTVVIALLASLLVAVTVVPYFASRWLKSTGGSHEPQEHHGPLERVYTRVLNTALRRRKATVAAGIVILVASVTPLFVINQNLFDQSGSDVAQVTVQMPAGSTLDATERETGAIAELLSREAAVDSVTAQSGVPVDPFAPAGTVPADPAQGQLTVVFGDEVPSDVNDRLQERLEGYDGPAEATLGTAGGPAGASTDEVSVQLSGSDPARISEAAEQVTREMEQIDGLTEIESDAQGEREELRLVPDAAALARAGLTTRAFADQLATLAGGEDLGTIQVDGLSAPLRLSPSGEALDQAALLRQTITGPSGRSVRVGDVARLEELRTVTTINRADGRRSATVTATAEGADLAGLQAELDERIDALKLPEGVTRETGGAFEDLEETFNSLLLAMLAAVALVYFVTVATFRSLLKPLILLLSIPLALSGAFAGLFISGSSLSLPALIGMLMLIGIVVTNAIVMLDLVERHREEGMEADDALRAGATRRLRPVLMTALATMGALAPLALGIGGHSGGAFIGPPLAIVVIGGLFSSTLLTLVIVPALYSLTARFTKARQGRLVDEQLAAASARRNI